MSRQSRLAEQIKRELSVLIQMELRDPRIGMVTISAVEVSRDLSLAKVYFTVFETEKIAASLKVLDASSGFLRKQLSNSLSMRSLPRLSFYHDESIERGRRVSSMIDTALAQDRALSDQDSSLEVENTNQESQQQD